jgi:hypothetical protein
MITRCFSLTALAALLLAASAQAALKYDLRLADDSKLVYNASEGQVIELQLWAQVTGTGAGLEGFQNGYGSIMSTDGGSIKGNLSATVAAPFAANGAQNGVAADLDGDGDFDLGSNLTTSSTSFLFARASSMQTSGGKLLPDGREFMLANVSFTITSIGANGSIMLNFVMPNFTGKTDIAALWMQDGLPYNTTAGSGGVAMVGEGVVITTAIPEPSQGLLLGLGALIGWTTRRRRR